MSGEAEHSTRGEELGTDVGRVAQIAILGTIGLALSVLFLRAGYYQAAGEEDTKKRVAVETAPLVKLASEQQAKLAGLKWVKKEEGIVAIPIEEAMKVALEEIKAGGTGLGTPPAPGAPVTPPAAEGSAQ